MPPQEIEYGGWPRNLRLANDSVELVITLAVGPRVLSYRPLGDVNIFKNYPGQLGGTDESAWMIRGGHRHWIGPEDAAMTYSLDNTPFAWESAGDHAVEMTNPGVKPWGITKKTRVELAPVGSQVTVTHTLINEGDQSWRVAPWALTVMAPGGVSILPQPSLGEHPRDLLPNRKMVLWPYTDMTDPRLRIGRHFLTLAQGPGLPIKFGLAHRGGWAAYLLGDQLFIKTVPWIEGADYVDFGCNYESFTNSDMLEVETLGPLVDLVPGKSVAHTEQWHLFGSVPPVTVEDSPALAEWLAPYLQKAGLT